MAQQALIDTERDDIVLAKISAMLTELYNSYSGGGVNPSVTTLTASGAISGASLAASAGITGATAVLSGLDTVGSIKLDTGTKTATAVAGAATLNKSAGIVTTEALTTAAGSDYTLTLTNSKVAAGDLAFISIDSNGSTGLPLAYSAKCTANTLTVIVRNADATDAFNAALKIGFAIYKA